MRSSRRAIASVFLSSAVFAAPAMAAAADEKSPIIVSGHGLEATPARAAYDTLEIGRDVILSSGSGRIESVLSSVPGFQQFRRSDSRSSNPSAQGVTLRALSGNATSRALVLLDGVPMADPFFGYIPLTALAPERLASIRVTRGGGSGPFGAGALAGVIELDSADAATLGLASGSVLVNDRGETEASGAIAPELGNGFAVISGRWDRGQGFDTTPLDQHVPATARARFDSWSAGVRMVQQLSPDVEVQLRGLAYEDRRTLRFEGADSSTEGQDASIRLVGRGDWQFDAVAYAQWRNFTNVVISSSTFTRVLDQKDTPSTGIGGKLELRPPLGDDHLLRLGVDYRRSEGDLSEDRYWAFSGAFRGSRFAGGNNSDLGLFADHEWQAADGLILTGGLRADNWSITDGYYRDLDSDGSTLQDDDYADRSGWDASWRVGFLADPAEGVRLRAAAYTGLRQPSLNELYRPFVVFPETTNANAALENERLKGFEAGVEFTPAPGIFFSLTAFDNRVENAIANVTVEQNVRQRQNLDAIHAQGIEWGTALSFGDVSLDGSFAFTNATVEGSGDSIGLDGLRPPQTPRWFAGATLAWAPAPGTRFAASLRHVGAQFEDDLESALLPAATTLDLFAQVPIRDGLSLILRAENLFDEDIITRNQDGAIDLGVPRTVWAGLRYGM